jgi:hypothetical protein
MRHNTCVVALFLFCLTLWGCGNSKFSDIATQLFGYSDGTYCAEVEYYNSRTGTSSSYTLNVEIEDNEVTKIYWPNGGWLDDDHFDPEELDDGECSFTSDKGYDYEVEITGPECSWSDESSFMKDRIRERKAYTCPDCGDKKRRYDGYCNDCTDEREEKTCPECGGYKYSYGDLCDDCRSNVTCPNCGDTKYEYEDICSSCEDEEY